MKNKMLGVQYLRGIAALMVAYFHLINQLPAYTPYLRGDSLINLGHFDAGVWIFFIISGFIMCVTALDSQPIDFAWKRVVRIIPLYWVLTLSVSVIAIIAPRVLNRTDLTPEFLLKSLFFISYANPSQHGALFPILVPGWSLNYEMFFYAVFTVILLLPQRSRIPSLAIVLICLFTCGQFIIPTPAFTPCVSPLLLLFLSGVLLGWIYRRGYPHIHPILIGICISIGIEILFSGVKQSWQLNYIAAFLIVFGIVSFDFNGMMPKWPWLLMLGDASYSLYLIHLFAFGVTRLIWKHLHANWFTSSTFIFASLGLAVILSIASYKFIERPTMNLLKPRKKVILATAV